MSRWSGRRPRIGSSSGLDSRPTAKHSFTAPLLRPIINSNTAAGGWEGLILFRQYPAAADDQYHQPGHILGDAGRPRDGHRYLNPVPAMVGNIWRQQRQ